jgi:hypothetical protein
MSAFARKVEQKAQGYLGVASPATEARRLPSRSGVMDATDDIKGLTPHAVSCERDCVGGDNPVAFYVPLLEYPQIPAIQIGGRWRIKKSSLNGYVPGVKTRK